MQTHDSECILDTSVNMKTNNLRFDAKGLQNNSQKKLLPYLVWCVFIWHYSNKVWSTVYCVVGVKKNISICFFWLKGFDGGCVYLSLIAPVLITLYPAQYTTLLHLKWKNEFVLFYPASPSSLLMGSWRYASYKIFLNSFVVFLVRLRELIIYVILGC